MEAAAGYLESGGGRIFRVALEGFGRGVDAVGQPAADIGRKDQYGLAFPRVARILTHLR